MERLVNLSWHSSYECGNALIDDQHRGLFCDANKLLDAILCGHSVNDVTALIDALIDAVVQHFQDEEIIFTAAGYPEALEHAAIHRELVEQAANLANRFHGGNLALGDLFHFLARDLVARHMLGADREFFGYLRPKP